MLRQLQYDILGRKKNLISEQFSLWTEYKKLIENKSSNYDIQPMLDWLTSTASTAQSGENLEYENLFWRIDLLSSILSIKMNKNA